MIVAQISDLHIRRVGSLAYRRVDTTPYLERAIATLNALEPQPDLILATGDLVDTGAPEEYARLAGLVDALRAPLFLLPGNHDAREALRAAFPLASYLPAGSHLSYVLERPGLRIVALDTTQAGREGGYLDDERLAWLEARLGEDARPALIAMHHPPLITGIAGMDALGFVGLAGFGAVVERHPQVVRVVTGHVHRLMVAACFGTVVVTSPSVAHQVALDLRPGREATFALEPPGLLLHVFDDAGDVPPVTHLLPTGEFPGPYGFREPDGNLIE